MDPDQTALKEQSDLVLHCLLRSVCSDTLNFYCMAIKFLRTDCTAGDRALEIITFL